MLSLSALAACGVELPESPVENSGQAIQASTLAETDCANGLDDEGDGLVDCADLDCNQQSCGLGCTCQAGVRTESTCSDAIDNDGDTLIDCVDKDCTGKTCHKSSGALGICSSTLQCL